MNQDVEKATRQLHADEIPRVARLLETKKFSDPSELVSFIHRYQFVMSVICSFLFIIIVIILILTLLEKELIVAIWEYFEGLFKTRKFSD
jgi:hypothetical protein